MWVLSLLACTSEPPAPDGVRHLSVDALREELRAPSSRPRIYNFWATWCQPCIAELPVLREYARAHPEVELVLVNVDLPSLLRTKVEPAIRKHDLESFRHLAVDDPDPSYALMALPGWPQSVPVTWIVAADGRKVRQFDVAVDPGMLDRALADAGSPR